jgi:alpha-galactosidase
VGIYPGTPFLQTIGTSNLGAGITFSASGLPAGLTLSSSSGIINGVTPSAGTYSVGITATGSGGTVQSFLNIVAGNTLGLTPAMGWNSWNSTYQDNVTAQILEDMADAMVRSGMRDAGYQYLNIDDAWALGTRNAQGHLVPNPALFPNGLQPVIDYIHARGLKFGIYTDAGTMTCSGAQPGSYNYETVDATDFANWGVDFVKEDYCNAPSDQATAIARYTTMSNALKASGRSIAFNICEWGQRQPWTWGQAAGGNSWRTTYDMRDNWQFGPASPPANQGSIGVLDAINLSAGRESYAGPGHFNDPDMLMVGVDGAGSSNDLGGTSLNTTEERTQVSMWAMLAAPLVANADLRKMDPSSPNYDAAWAASEGPILQNNEIIKIDQDALGKQASRIINNTSGGQQIWLKPLADGSYAVALLNTSNAAQNMTVNWSDLGIAGLWSVRDLWAHANQGTFSGSYTALSVPSHGTVVLDLSMSSAPGTTLYWDINGTNPGSGAGGTTGGTWSGNSWNSTADGTGSPGAWVAGGDAVFSAGTDGVGSYTVSAGTTQTVRNLTVAAGNVTLGASGGFLLSPGAVWGAATGASLTVALPVANNGNLFTVSTTGATTISGVISGAGGLTKSGPGILSITNTNSYTGITTIFGGMITVGSDTSLGAAPGAATVGKIVLNAGALSANNSFTLNSNRGIALGPAGAGTIDVAAGKTLTYGGIMANASGGAGGLVKTGSGTLVLTGRETYSGPTIVNGGTVALNVANGATGVFNASGTVSVNNGSTIVVSQDNAYGGYGAGGTGDGGINCAPLVLYSGGQISAAGSTHIGSITLSGGTLASSAYNTTWGGWFLDRDITVTGGTISTISAQKVVIPGSGNGAGSLRTINVNAGSILNFNGSTLGTYNGISSGTLNVAGAGLMVVTGANDHRGGTTINGGTVQIGNGGTSGDLGAAAIVNNAVLAFNRSDSPTFGNTISGTGAINQIGPGSVTLSGSISGATTVLIKQGQGTLVLTGTNSYLGGTTVAGGTLIASNSRAIPDGTNLTIGNGALFPAPIVPAAAVSGSTCGCHHHDVGDAGALAPVPEPGTGAIIALALAIAAIYRRVGRPN